MKDKVEPTLVWGKEKCSNETVAKMFSGVEICKPWTRSQLLPGRSYKTTNMISHPPTLPLFQRVQTKPIQLSRDTMIRDYRFSKIHYDTNYKLAYTYKSNNRGITDTPNVPHATEFNLNYQWLDKLRTFPPGKIDPGVSEMKYQHITSNTFDGTGVLADLKPNVICQLHAPGKDALDKTISSINCIQKIMDPYISTTQSDYIYHDELEIRKYKHVKLKPVQVLEKKSIYDESFVGKQFMDRFVRIKIPLVPHRGMISEAMDNYKQPLDELAHNKPLVCTMPKFRPLSKGEVMAIPGMYHTEYSHIGHDWPLSSVV